MIPPPPPKIQKPGERDKACKFDLPGRPLSPDCWDFLSVY